MGAGAAISRRYYQMHLAHLQNYTGILERGARVFFFLDNVLSAPAVRRCLFPLFVEDAAREKERKRYMLFNSLLNFSVLHGFDPSCCAPVTLQS